MDSDSEFSSTPPDIADFAKNITLNLLPTKSRETSLYWKGQFESSSIDSGVKDEYESKVPSVWFSPRLGRKKRTLKEDGYKISEQEQQLLEAFGETPITLVALNANDKLICKNLQGKRINFIPRLGRNVDEDNMGNEKWSETDGSAEYVFQRSPPFAPRLGKRFVSYSPRLGRDI